MAAVMKTKTDSLEAVGSLIIIICLMVLVLWAGCEAIDKNYSAPSDIDPEVLAVMQSERK